MLTDDDRDALRDWWDEDTTASVDSSFPIIARIVARERAAALREAADLLSQHGDTCCDPEDRLTHLASPRWLRIRADKEAAR